MPPAAPRSTLGRIITHGHPSTRTTLRSAPRTLQQLSLTGRWPPSASLATCTTRRGSPAATTVYLPPTLRAVAGALSRSASATNRVTYDLTGTPSPNNTVNNMPASLGWAAWRLTDIFSAGPVDPSNAYGPTQELIELPARVNINGVTRDGGAALRTLLAGFTFQPATSVDSGGQRRGTTFSHTDEHSYASAINSAHRFHGSVPNLSRKSRRVSTPRLPRRTPAGVNKPWGPFFERGEFGEIEGTNSAGKPAAIFRQECHR